jgi:Uma2 family endonuclease
MRVFYPSGSLKISYTVHVKTKPAVESAMGLPLEKYVMTAAEFIDWEATQAEKQEFYHGEVFATTGARQTHNIVAINLGTLLKTFLRGTQCRALMTDMRIQVAENVFYPDILVTCDPDDLKADLVMHHPRVIIEILSPNTAAFDRGDKFAAYRQIASLQEYVLIDPDTHHIDVYRRMPENDWLLAASEAAHGLRLKCLDFHATLAEVFEDLDT